jgi:hypothetical protein
MYGNRIMNIKIILKRGGGDKERRVRKSNRGGEFDQSALYIPLLIINIC